MTRQELYQLLDESIPLPGADPRQVLNKEQSIKQYISYMLDRTNSMFEYENLPDTIPAYILELYLQIFGSCAISEVPSSFINETDNLSTPPGLYAFYGSIGGERDIYYRPTRFIIANPRLKNSLERNIIYSHDLIESTKDPCIIIRNDTNYMGLYPLFSRYAAQLSENDISIRAAQINARAQTAIAVGTDADAESARKYFDDLEAGKVGIIGKMSFLEGITMSNVSTMSSNHVIQLIELQQYLKASWYNELGLNVNFNMKREYMSEEEIAVNTDILLPLVDDMLKCREAAVDLINATFGTNIEVHKASAWANKEQEELAALAESAGRGEIPLADPIAEKITGNATEVSTETQGEISTSEGSFINETGKSGNTGDSDMGRPTESRRSAENDESGTIVITAQQVEVTVVNDESEAPTEPEKSDSD